MKIVETYFVSYKAFSQFCKLYECIADGKTYYLLQTTHGFNFTPIEERDAEQLIRDAKYHFKP